MGLTSGELRVIKRNSNPKRQDRSSPVDIQRRGIGLNNIYSLSMLSFLTIVLLCSSSVVKVEAKSNSIQGQQTINSFLRSLVQANQGKGKENKKKNEGVTIDAKGFKGVAALKGKQEKVQVTPKKYIMIEEDSQKYFEYSKANQRKADRIRRQRRKNKEIQEDNILKDIKKNPYLDDQYANLTRQDLKRVKKWRYIVGQDFTRPSVLAQEQKQYYTQKYNIDKYQELPFCLIVPTFNNKPRKRAERNLRSIMMQDYRNFHFTIIDDGSADGTGKFIQSLLSSQTSIDSSRYEVVIHTQRTYSIASIRNASKSFCKPEDIVIVVDGDDELLGRQVLKLFNSVFQERGIWYMYTNFLGSIGIIGYSRPYHPDIIQKNAYRQYSFAVSHLRAYYNKLLLKIKDSDLQDENGNYFKSSGDMAIAIPCLEMAHTKVAYVPEMTYFYNFNTGLNVHRKRLNEQRQNNLKIRAKTRFTPLDKLV